ncbi:MAG: hypothetical protein M1835_001539, partial [Candelina submexicana]
DALGVKLGHRRKLQREISNTRGAFARESALQSASRVDNYRNTETEDASCVEQREEKGSAGKKEKRKYRRHPKADENAPDRPPSAYVIFSNKIREDLRNRYQSLSFTEIAKLVGEKWQVLSRSEKEPFESQAATLKAQYNVQLAQYKETNNYKEYQQYVTDFKAKNSANQSSEGKRPKLEKDHSAASSNSPTSSVLSQYDSSTPHSSNAPIGLYRGQSTRSIERASPTGKASDIMQPDGHAGIQRLSLFRQPSIESNDPLTSVNQINTLASTHGFSPTSDIPMSNRTSNTQNLPSISNLDNERSSYRGRGSPYNPDPAVYRSNDVMAHIPSMPIGDSFEPTLSSEPPFQPVRPVDDVRRLRSLPLPANLPYKSPADIQYSQGQLPKPVQLSITDPQPLSSYFGHPPTHVPGSSSPSSESERLLPVNSALQHTSIPGGSLTHEHHDLRTRSLEGNPSAPRGEERGSEQYQETAIRGRQSISPLSVLAEVAKDAFEPP